MDISPKLHKMNINHRSAAAAVQHTRDWIEGIVDGDIVVNNKVIVDPAPPSRDVIANAVYFVNHLLGTELTAQQLVEHYELHKTESRAKADSWAITFAQAIVEQLVKADCVLLAGSTADLIKTAWERATKSITCARYPEVFSKAEVASTTGGEVKAVSDMVDVKVEVKADGKIKKGGKEKLSEALYHKYVASLNGAPYVNQDFIKILVDEAGMTKSGATTYNYNMKKKFGGQIEKRIAEPVRMLAAPKKKVA